jgi:hypothetical protein
VLAAVRQVGEDARKLAQMLIMPEGRCLTVNHGAFDGKAMVGGHSCNTRLRCLIVSLDLGRLVTKRSKIRWALDGLFPANNNSSIRCPSLLHFSTLLAVAPVGLFKSEGSLVLFPEGG